MKTMGKHSQRETTDLKHSLSNEKRLESLKLKSQQNKQQRNIIKSALAEVDSGKSINKRIVFRSDDEDEAPDDKISSNHLGHSSGEKRKRLLFDDSDSNSEESLSGKNNNLDDAFSIKPQFEGKKGQELLALQARFKNDERFQLDERFLDNEEHEEGSTKEGEDETTEGMDINAEREKNFEILQEVLGFQFPTQPLKKKIEKYQTIKDSSKLRYDPTREDAENFEIKRGPKEKSSSKKSKQKAADPEPVILPEVSKERFFKVAADLKEAFSDTSQNKTFSFLKDFSISSDREDNNNDGYFTEPIIQPKHSSFQKSAFRYDSSDNEDDEDASQFLPHKKISEQKHQEQNSSKPKWKFFFSPGDPRLKEGVQYFKKSGTDEEIEEWWKKTRSAMLDIIQAKRKVSKCKTMVNKRRGKRGK